MTIKRIIIVILAIVFFPWVYFSYFVKGDDDGPQVSIDATQTVNIIEHRGLEWMPITDSAHNWNTTNEYCNTAVIDNRSGWRLPKKVELEDLYSHANLPDHSLPKGPVWTATPFKENMHHLVGLKAETTVDFDNNYDRRYAVCVYGKQTYFGEDSEIGFERIDMFWFSVNDKSRNWVEADEYCKTSEHLNKSGWRLPTKDELIDFGKTTKTPGRDLGTSDSWSSTADDDGNHFYADVNNGGAYATDDSAKRRFVCVNNKHKKLK